MTSLSPGSSCHEQQELPGGQGIDITHGSAVQDCIVGIVNHAERLLVTLDLNRLFSADEQALFEASA